MGESGNVVVYFHHYDVREPLTAVRIFPGEDVRSSTPGQEISERTLCYAKIGSEEYPAIVLSIDHVSGLEALWNDVFQKRRLHYEILGRRWTKELNLNMVTPEERLTARKNCCICLPCRERRWIEDGKHDKPGRLHRKASEVFTSAVTSNRQKGAANPKERQILAPPAGPQSEDRAEDTEDSSSQSEDSSYEDDAEDNKLILIKIEQEPATATPRTAATPSVELARSPETEPPRKRNMELEKARRNWVIDNFRWSAETDMKAEGIREFFHRWCASRGESVRQDHGLKDAMISIGKSMHTFINGKRGRNNGPTKGECIRRKAMCGFTDPGRALYLKLFPDDPDMKSILIPQKHRKRTYSESSSDE